MLKNWTDILANFLRLWVQQLKGKFLIKGKRLNKLDAVFSNNSTIEEDTVSEEDEAADCKENEQKSKSKVGPWQHVGVKITLD